MSRSKTILVLQSHTNIHKFESNTTSFWSKFEPYAHTKIWFVNDCTLYIDNNIIRKQQYSRDLGVGAENVYLCVEILNISGVNEILL